MITSYKLICRKLFLNHILCVYSLRKSFFKLLSGAFGVVLQSTYSDPETKREITVAVKGLKGDNHISLSMVVLNSRDRLENAWLRALRSNFHKI